MFIHGSHFSYTTATNVGPVKKIKNKTLGTILINLAKSLFSGKTCN